jgi:YidC/Oxa1 family membrane protein insertase
MILANIIESAFGPLIDVFKAIMVEAHTLLGGSWGWAIIALTIVIRIVTLPLMVKQFRNMAKLQLHAPEINSIKERFKADRQRQSEEMMKYYREQGVNPLGGCLPMLIQFPVLISLFYMLRTDLKEKICGPAMTAYLKTPAALHIKATLATTGCGTVLPHSASFLFIDDITVKATGVVLIVLIALYLATMLTTSYFSTAQLQGSQRWMMLLLPVFFTVIIIRYPAGLLLYWIISNMTQLPLQWFARRQVKAPPVPADGVIVGNGAVASGAARAAVGRTRPASSPSRAAPPPQSPRKRKKRSGRRR